jgi:trehalose-phosphatase
MSEQKKTGAVHSGDVLFILLQSFANEPESTVVATDIDGTISKLVPCPEHAVIEPLILNLLTTCIEKYIAVVLVSGRSVKKIQEMAAGLKGYLAIGSHGMELMDADGRVFLDRDTIHAAEKISDIFKDKDNWLPEELKEIVCECKTFGITLHYRFHPDKKKQIEKIAAEIAAKYGLDMRQSKMAVELVSVPETNKGMFAKNKGEAIKRLLDLLVLDKPNSVIAGVGKYVKRVVYFGDDITDIDVFKTFKDASFGYEGLSIGVSSDEVPRAVKEHADFMVNGIEGVRKALKILAKSG